MISELLFPSLVLISFKVDVLQSQIAENIFAGDFCEENCVGRQHTMCPIENRKPNCSDFKYITFERAQSLIESLTNGHNGVRNRIAERMHVPNMLKVSWDAKLALMAENFLFRCGANLSDPCTLTGVVFTKVESINEFFRFNHSSAFIVQNTYLEMGTVFPYKFVERVIRDWYLEKDGMRAPTLVPKFDGLMKLLGENNFTHIAYPFVHRFGCAIARFNGVVRIVCNYYPFFRTITNSMYFQSGEPATSCPARFPLRDDLFESLCTDHSETYLESGAHNIVIDLWKIPILLFLMLVLM